MMRREAADTKVMEVGLTSRMKAKMEKVTVRKRMARGLTERHPHLMKCRKNKPRGKVVIETGSPGKTRNLRNIVLTTLYSSLSSLSSLLFSKVTSSISISSQTTF